MSTEEIINAVESGNLINAGEVLNDVLMGKVASALRDARQGLGNTLVGEETISEEDTEYEKFFRAALKKFGVSSPDEFESDEEKKKFFNWVDKNYKGKKESVELGEATKTIMQLADEHAQYHYDYDQGSGEDLRSAPAKMEKIEKEITKRFGSKVTEMVIERSRTLTYESEYASGSEGAKMRKEIEDFNKKLSKIS